ncbi:hypothetical protein [Phyllobacterium ifriqiyense]|uniref:hypothetical protein n=1 Tax=Phyllobacterium ifriqiyense TaxID=314238 RepID=UPI0033945FBB
MKDPRELAARALCRKHGLPENTKFEGKPMWQSYLDEVEIVLDAVKFDELVTASRKTQ